MQAFVFCFLFVFFVSDSEWTKYKQSECEWAVRELVLPLYASVISNGSGTHQNKVYCLLCILMLISFRLLNQPQSLLSSVIIRI